MKKQLITLIAGIVLFAIASGEDGLSLTFYRGANGTVSEESSRNAVLMRQHAKEAGYIDIWITLDYPFSTRFDEMTQQEKEAQAAEVAAGFADILEPLVNKSRVYYPKSGPFIQGPGCAIRATKTGLNSILDDPRIIQVVAMSVGA